MIEGLDLQKCWEQTSRLTQKSIRQYTEPSRFSKKFSLTVLPFSFTSSFFFKNTPLLQDNVPVSAARIPFELKGRNFLFIQKKRFLPFKDQAILTPACGPKK
jgi:hypothetical protein